MKNVLLTLVCALVAGCGTSCPDDIHRACAKSGCVDKVKALVAKDSSLLTKPDGRGLFPLNNAVDAKTAEVLVDAGAEVNLKAGVDQATPIYTALERDRGDVAAYLLAHGAELRDMNWSIRQAVSDGRARSVEALLDAGAQVNAAEAATGATLLHLAVLNNRLAVAKVLVKRGADVNAVLASGVNTMSLGPSGVGTQFKAESASAGGATPLTIARSEEMKAFLRDAGSR